MNPNPMQDIKPPAENLANSSTQLIEAEVEHGIPVKNQSQPKNDSGSANPMSSKQFVEEGEAKSDIELESVLKDINKDVKNGDKKSPKPSLMQRLFSKKVNQKEKTKEVKDKAQPQQARPLFAIVAAFIIAGGLSALAFHVYSQEQKTGSNKNQPSVSSTKKTTVQNLVKPTDLSDLSYTMASKLSQFNNTQDFNSTDLSDKNLGL
jgi:hypothetical protein